MGDDADAVDSEKWAAAVLLIVCFFLDGVERISSEKSADLPHLRAHEFVLEPLENRHRDRFARFQDHIADKTVAHYDLDWIFEKMAALDVADKVERALLQHFEDFLRHLSAFYVFLAERYQTDRRIFVAEHMARINRAHERILKKMFRARIDVRARVD